TGIVASFKFAASPITTTRKRAADFSASSQNKTFSTQSDRKGAFAQNAQTSQACHLFYAAEERYEPKIMPFNCLYSHFRYHQTGATERGETPPTRMKSPCWR
ncbi:hypothetical protein, partial [Paraburkholderia fynbosensis]|uniref:hypothetical protein n=1 Tax=Paraburkholderia fynbosensis TaxID=1200993 RepID=UPI001C2E90EB